MKFGKALKALQDGALIKRVMWLDDRTLGLMEPGPDSDNTEPYIYECDEQGSRPWTPTHADLLANDWIEE